MVGVSGPCSVAQQHSRWFSRGTARVARRLCETLPRNESGAALVREPAPEPVDEHEQSIAESDEKVEVNDPPQQPRQDTLELEPAQVRNRGRSTNRRHRPVVAIP